MGFFARFLSNHVLANILFVLVLILGFLSYQQLPRAKDPDINFNWINILTVLPGASSLEVEKRITDPIEEAIGRGVSDIRFVSSTSRDGVSTILVRFDQISEKEFDKRVADLRREVQNAATDQLPKEAKDPQIVEITTSSGFPTAMMLLTSKTYDEKLRRYGAILQKELEQWPDVGSVNMLGTEDPELHIAFDPGKLDGLGISPTDIADTVRGYFKDTAIGDVKTSHSKWVLRLEGTSGSLEELESMPIVGASGVVSLGSIASIYNSQSEAQTLTRYQGEPSILFSINKRDGVNTITLIERLQQFLETENSNLQGIGYQLVLADDQTVSTVEAIDLMQNNALIGLIFVVLVSWVFLGARIALLTSIGIPFTLAGTFFIIYVTDLSSLNTGVLLGAVIALGMIVDDAVVVVESIYYRLQRGARPMEAAIESLKEVAAPVTTSVLTTIAVFLPLMLLPGILGEFMKIIPMVVCLALAVSLIEAFWMLPAHINYLRVSVTDKTKSQLIRERFTNRLRHIYSIVLLRAMRYPRRAFGVVSVVFILALSIIGSGFLKVNFFAADALRLFYVNVEMPADASLEESLAMTLELEQKALALLEDDEVRTTLVYAGQSFTQTEPLYGDNLGQVMVSLAPQINGHRTVREIVAKQEEALSGAYKNGRVSVILLEDGPPVGQPINIKIRGDDFATLQEVADDFTAYMEQQGSFRNISLDFKAGSPEVSLKLNGDAIKRAGLSPEKVARTLQSYVDGEIVTSFQNRGEEVSVRVLSTLAMGNMEHIDMLFDQVVHNDQGRAVALGDLLETSYGYGQQNIRHYNFLRTMALSADFDKEAMNTLEANELVSQYWLSIAGQYPDISIDFSGELDDLTESLSAITMLFGAGIGLIYLILGTQFRSYWQPLLVLFSVPLAFVGVIFGLSLTNSPLSMFTLYGVVALAGIAVNSSIVLISAANSRIAAGMSVLHATVYAARRRVIPILITSLTTIAGLFSLAAGIAGESVVWGPVATAIVSGLFFSTLLNLFVVPLLYRAIQSSKLMTGIRRKEALHE